VRSKLISPGFFFEPSEEGQIKICNEFPGFVNMETLPDGRQTSKPRSNAQNPTDTIPDRCRKEIRELLAKTIPRFKDRPFVIEKICWCADSMDRNWLISKHPRHHRVVIATGDSGVGFKMLPVIGRYIGDVVEGKSLDPMLREAWDWRPQKTNSNHRLGGDGHVRDLKEMPGWKASSSRSSRL
jgi:glycine/D-amino acid oxidase-like deaminating enzyme